MSKEGTPEHMADSSKYMFGLLITVLLGIVSYVWVQKDTDVRELAEKVGDLAVSTGELNANFANMLSTSKMNNEQLTTAIIDLRQTVGEQAPASEIARSNAKDLERLEAEMKLLWSNKDHEAYAARTDVRKDAMEKSINRIDFEIEKITNYLKQVHRDDLHQFED